MRTIGRAQNVFYRKTLLAHYAASRKPIKDNGTLENTGIYKETGLGPIGLGSNRNEIFTGSGNKQIGFLEGAIRSA
jgi:hypothetical protein